MNVRFDQVSTWNVITEDGRSVGWISEGYEAPDGHATYGARDYEYGLAGEEPMEFDSLYEAMEYFRTAYAEEDELEDETQVAGR